MNRVHRCVVSLIPLIFLWGVVLGQDLCVISEYAHLREGPGIQHPISWKVFRYMPLKRVTKENAWYKVEDVDGRAHWIREDLVSSSLSCAVVRADYANLRQAPQVSAAQTRARRGEKYLSFRVLEKKASWVKVEDQDGDQAWIHKPLLWLR